MRHRLSLALLLAIACLQPWSRIGSAHPPVAVVVDAQPQGAVPPRPTPQQVRTYRGYLTGCLDSAKRVVWTPALPGASDDVQTEWLQCLVDKGATHVPIGPFTPGPVYPGVPWSNPDWTRNPGAIRGLVLKILSTRTRQGHGMVPVIFLVGGGPTGQVAREFPAIAPTLSAALEGLGPHTITLPCGWESEAWRARECKDAVDLWRPLSQGSVLAWHGWPNRADGSSNDPFNPKNDDPFLDPPQANGGRYGNGARFWRELPFEMFLYQTNAIRTVAEARCQPAPYTDPDGKSGMAFYVSNCRWKNRLQASVNRVGRSVCTDDFGEGAPCAWPTRIFVIFETVTYFDFRRMLEPGTREAVADEADALCQQSRVVCGFGDGLPARLRPAAK